MSMEMHAIIGMGSAAAAAIVANLPAETQLDSVGKWPITIALVALCAWSVWLLYRQADKSRTSLETLFGRVADLYQKLADRERRYDHMDKHE